MSESIKNNVENIRVRISEAAEKSGRTVDDIHLVAVSKMQPLEKIYQAHQAGIEFFGENKVQDLIRKVQDSTLDLKWHMVGHLQSNKINKVIGNVEMIQSIDSVHLLEKLDRAGQERDLVSRVLLQVNSSGEESKFGFEPDEIFTVCESAENMTSVEICGLMTIGPLTTEREEVIKSFRRLKKLSEELNAVKSVKVRMDYLSMGMSGDYEIAIEEGSNLVRIGTAIFGPRIQGGRL
jgi:pyridoxal phosphate enzyme (YggS family)